MASAKSNVLETTQTGWFLSLCIILLARYEAECSQCFHLDNVQGGLPDLSEEERPQLDNSLFFHDSTCIPALNYTLTIQPRSACALEAAARLHPNSTVYLLYNSPIKYPHEIYSDTLNYRIIQTLLQFPNLKIRRVKYNKYIAGTPVEYWPRRQKEIDNVPHRSDIDNQSLERVMMKFITLWKYGGTSVDLDVILMKNLDIIGTNFAGRQSEEIISSGVLNFDSKGLGHKLATRCLSEVYHANGTTAGIDFSSAVLTRVLKRICTENSSSLMIPKACEGFKILTQPAFHPIPPEYVKLYFDDLKASEVLQTVKDSYANHIWDAVNQNTIAIDKDAPAAYITIATNSCPSVYNQTGRFLYLPNTPTESSQYDMHEIVFDNPEMDF